jgi:hypothetical protein
MEAFARIPSVLTEVNPDPAAVRSFLSHEAWQSEFTRLGSFVNWEYWNIIHPAELAR